MALISNKKVGFNYEALEKYSAGVELLGLEVKTLKSGRGSLEGAYVTIRGGEAYITGMFIPPYQENNTPKEYDAYRPRRLLLSKEEIWELSRAESAMGLTIVPISVYNKGSLIKVDIAIVRGKKKFDKRETIKKRETDRETRRQFSDK